MTLDIFPRDLFCFEVGWHDQVDTSLCSAFSPSDFFWKWSIQKTTKKKEQLSALHGFKRDTGKKWWAWHGQGENQLHFSGESEWWPQLDKEHSVSFRFPNPKERMSLEDFMALLSRVESPI